MNLDERKQISTHYFTKGNGLIDSSKIIKSNYGFDILLYIGIELILKSFLIIKDEAISRNKLVEYGHDLKLLLKDAEKYDNLNTISNPEFIEIINWLLDSYSVNMVELRYNTKPKLRVFPSMTYDVLNSHLTSPMNYTVREFRKR
jgi:hypothetical protein